MFCNPCLTQLEANEQSLNLDSLNDFTIPPNAKLPLEQIAANVRSLPDVYIYIDHVCFGEDFSMRAKVRSFSLVLVWPALENPPRWKPRGAW